MTQTEELAPSMDGVLSQKPETQLGSLLAIKDDIIGHALRKSVYINHKFMRPLIELLRCETTPADVKVEATIVLGSLCHGSANDGSFGGVNHADVIYTLTSLLDPDLYSPAQIIASLCALNTYYEFNPSVSNTLLTNSFYEPLAQLFQLHRKPLPRSVIIEQVQLAALLLERSCGNADLVDEVAELDILNAMLSFMYSFVFASWDLQKDYSFNKAPPAIYSRLLPSILFALGALIKDDRARATQVAAAKPSSPLVGAMFEEEYPMMRILLRLTKNIHGLIKLGAVECLTYMFRVGAIGRREVGEINNLVVPILVRLFDDSPEVRMRAPQILGHLVTDSEEMQKVACEANAIKKLSEIILKAKSPPISSRHDEYSTHHADKLKESALSAIAAITLFKDDYRKQVIDTGLIPSIVASMSSSVPGIRAAACQCTRSLSRSVCILRTNLVDAGIAVPLFRLLSDESLEVKIAATGAVCNLMLEFSPMRKAILEQGAMKILCQHTYSQYAQLRLNAVWALKHFCYQPDEPLQVEQMLHELGHEQLMKLCEDEDVGVQEQALSIIRNVMTGEVKSISLLFDNIGSARLMRLIVDKLGSAYSEIVAAAAYICVHIGTGTEAHRNALISNSSVLRAILHHMDSPSDNVRIGCVWTIINLIVTEETFDARTECRSRAAILRDLGVFVRLVRMKETDSSLDVKERAKSALAHLDGLNL